MTVKRQWIRNSVWCVALVVLTACSDETGVSMGAPHKSPTPEHPAMTATVRPSNKANPHGAVAQGSGMKTPPGAQVAGARPSSGGAGASGPGLVGRLASLELKVSVPEGWKEVPSSSSMRLATVQLPRAEGDSLDGEMSITHLPGGGGLQANIDRWRGQFRERPEVAPRTFLTSGEVRVTTVELAGTFNPGSGPGMGSRGQTGKGEISGAVLFGAIVEAPHGRGFVFFKAWGPQVTMERWRESFDGFIDSLTHLH